MISAVMEVNWFIQIRLVLEEKFSNKLYRAANMEFSESSSKRLQTQ